MHNLILSNWKAKITSLVLAVAIWYLIDTNLSRPDRVQFPIPGTMTPMPDSSPTSIVPIPGGGSPSSQSLRPTPDRIEDFAESIFHV